METYRRLEGLFAYQKRSLFHMPESDRRWPQSPVQEDSETYGAGPCWIF